MEFKEILKDILIELDLSQTEIAKIVGIKQSQISEWLSGKSKPGYDNLKLLSERLCISTDRLLGLDDN